MSEFTPAPESERTSSHTSLVETMTCVTGRLAAVESGETQALEPELLKSSASVVSCPL